MTDFAYTIYIIAIPLLATLGVLMIALIFIPVEKKPYNDDMRFSDFDDMPERRVEEYEEQL